MDQCQSSQTNKNQTHQHLRVECDLCGMKVSQVHLGRHRMRRHPTRPNKNEMRNVAGNRLTRRQPKTVVHHQVSSEDSASSTNDIKPIGAELRQTIENQSKKSYSDEIRFVTVNVSERELFRLMNHGRICRAFGKFFLHDSQAIQNQWK